jgi:hypothetical protein
VGEEVLWVELARQTGTVVDAIPIHFDIFTRSGERIGAFALDLTTEEE